MDVQWFWGLALSPALAAAIWAGLDTPERLDKAIRWLTLLLMTATLLISAQPAIAQVDSCPIVMSYSSQSSLGSATLDSGETLVAEETSRNRPWTIDLTEGESVEFEIQFAAPPGTRASVVLSEAKPTLPWSPNDTLVWLESVREPPVAGRIAVTERNAISITFESNGVRSRALPIGTLGFTGSLVGPNGDLLCETEIWVRIVDQPFGTVTGWIGISAILLGAVGLVGLSSPVAPPQNDITTLRNHPRSPHTKARFLDSSGKPIDPDLPLTPGTKYHLEVRISPTLRQDETDDSKTRTITVRAFGRVFEFERPSIALDIGLGEWNVATIPLKTPDREGPFPLHLEFLHRGHLLQLDTIDVPVGEAAGGQHLLTGIRATDFSATDLDMRSPREALILLLRGLDHSVDVEVLDSTSQPFMTFDSPHQAEALLTVARRARERLYSALEGTADHPAIGMSLDVPTGDLESAIPLVAEAGGQLHDVLFGSGKLRASAAQGAERLGDVLPANSVLQVNVDRTGIGVSTLPWGLLYDRPVFLSSESKLCPSFADHPPDQCPSSGDPLVICPWGFWGFRYVLEHPPAWSGTSVPPPLPASIANKRPLSVSYVTDPEFPTQQNHLDRLTASADLEVVSSTTLEELRRTWTEDGSDFDLIHFYTHHVLDPGTGAPALIIGGEYMTEAHVNAMRLGWPSKPLVVMAGCATGVAHSLSAPSSLISAFRLAGASGAIGSECSVRETIADGLIGPFLSDVFAKKPIGRSLLDMRRRALREQGSIAGLVYSLYALSDLHFEINTAAGGSER